MKKKKEFEDWCNKKLQKLQKILLLQGFTLKPIKLDDKQDSIASCKFNYPYQHIEIFYATELYKNWEKKDYESVVGVLCHEMIHPITDELYNKGYQRFTGKNELEDARERLTDHIANIVVYHKLIV